MRRFRHLGPLKGYQAGSKCLMLTANLSLRARDRRENSTQFGLWWSKEQEARGPRWVEPRLPAPVSYPLLTAAWPIFELWAIMTSGRIPRRTCAQIAASADDFIIWH